MIRKANIADIDAINNLGILIIKNFKDTYSVEKYINDEKYIILVNTNENIVNGVLIVFKNVDSYELELIVISEKWRHKGIAINLLTYFISNFTKSGDIIFLEVSTNNVAALSLYRKFMFDVINVRKNYYENADAYVMKKVI